MSNVTWMEREGRPRVREARCASCGSSRMAITRYCDSEGFVVTDDVACHACGMPVLDYPGDGSQYI